MSNVSDMNPEANELKRRFFKSFNDVISASPSCEWSFAMTSSMAAFYNDGVEPFLEDSEAQSYPKSVLFDENGIVQDVVWAEWFADDVSEAQVYKESFGDAISLFGVNV